MQAQYHVNEPRLPEVTGVAKARPQTLLVVDDDEGPRESLRILFEASYHVLLAENGPRAMDLVGQNHIDAAVLDIRMSGMSGIEVLGQIKAVDPAIEVVMLTGYAALDTAQQALRYRACDYLRKPFEVSTMRRAVTDAMERRLLSDKIKANLQMLDQLGNEIQNLQLRHELQRTRGEIYESIIHDIKSPLTCISFYSEMTKEKIMSQAHLKSKDLSDIRDHLAQISDQVKSCLEISYRYLRFLRDLRTEPAWVSANQILADLKKLLRSHPYALNQRLTISALPSDLEAKIGGTELIQILLNLAFNAVQSVERCHDTWIRAEEIRDPLELAAFTDGPQEKFLNREGFQNTPPLLAVSVEDDGSGIPPESMARLFETYFTTKPRGRGTGLGLSIILRLVKSANGAIHVTSRPKGGTRFTVYLPARTAKDPVG